MPLLIAPRALAAQYASMFLAWGVAAWLLARERRRYVRQPVLWGLLVWAAGVLLSSTTWLWFAAFAVTAAVAAHRVRPVAQRLRTGRPGPWPRDAGTSRHGH